MEQPYLYQETFTVADYECDVADRLKLSYLLRHLQSISTAQLNEMDLGYRRLYEEGTVFLLSRLGARIHRMPHSSEQVTFATAPQDIKGAKFRRQARLCAQSGEVLAEAQSVWFIVDPATFRVVRPSAFRHTLPSIPEEQRLAPDLGGDRVRPAGAVIACGRRQVAYSDMDLNRHLNNTVYADILTDALPYEKMAAGTLREVFLHYQNQALLGDILSTVTQQGEGGCYYVTGLKNGEHCFAAKALFAD